MRNLPQAERVYSGNGTLAAQTLYVYDETALTNRSDPTGYTAPQHAKHGNLTRKRAWLNTTDAFRTTTYAYDILGNILTVTDPKNKSTQISYNDNCSAAPASNLYAFPTAATNSLNQTAHATWDCYLGKQTVFQDANSVQTTYSYAGDPFDRLKMVTRALGTTKESYIKFNYPDLRTTETKRDLYIKDDQALVSTTVYDGLLRTVETREALGGGCFQATARSYDAKGRLSTTSLPYNSCSETKRNVTTAYDGADRVVSVTTPDGSVTTTGYNGNETTVSDPAGVTRLSTTDALGRLVGVVEDPTGLGYQTSYVYDVLDNLTNVTQGAQPPRTFTYNSLSQLVEATNPESGSICYGTRQGGICVEDYDPNGNLNRQTDARGVATTYAYDDLNRLIGKTYSDQTTPPVTLSYDTGGGCPGSAPARNVGRLTGTSTAAVGAIPAIVHSASYDASGLVCASSQTVGNDPAYQFEYTYSLADAPITEKYPSGRVVATQYDALNRPVGTSSGTTIYVNTENTGYASNGALQQLGFGPASTQAALQSFTYDTYRQQLLGTVVTGNGTQQLGLEYRYCANGNQSCATNNGNVHRQTLTAPKTGGGTLVLATAYSYDGANRITSAAESGEGTGWSQGFSYGNQFGNLSITGDGDASDLRCGSYDAANNRCNASGFGYDNAGNLTTYKDRTLTYDAENRQTSLVDGSATWTYVYDGEGRRVKKTDGGRTVVYVYDAMGRLAAEYDSAPPANQPDCTTCFLTADHLGSTRLVTDSSGTVKRRYDYHPFGWEVNPGSGNRSTVTGYMANDRFSTKFTGKERDTESGLNLDYFGARYYAGAQGRFTGPDPKMFPSVFDDPQSWNKYTYTRNNPLRYVDPDGEDWKDVVFGAMNASGSDFLMGAGRATGGNADFRAGQAIGDAAATVAGTALALFGGGGAVITAPAALTGAGAAIPAAGAATAVHGAMTAIVAGANLANAALFSAQDRSPSSTGKQSLSGHKEALGKVHEEVGKQPKGEPGKFGSPQAGDSQKGYSLDPAHPNAKPGTPEAQTHINWWDFTRGKKNRGGRTGAEPVGRPNREQN